MQWSLEIAEAWNRGNSPAPLAMTSIITKPPAVLPRPRPDRSYASNPPKSKLGYFLWRRRMWFESTFALTVMEPWEKVVMRKLPKNLYVVPAHPDPNNSQ